MLHDGETYNHGNGIYRNFLKKHNDQSIGKTIISLNLNFLDFEGVFFLTQF